MIGGTRDRAGHPPLTGVWRGQITRVEGTNAWVEIPRLTPGYQYGPLSLTGVGYGLEPSPDDGDDAYVVNEHAAIGRWVLVAFVEGRVDDPIILRPLDVR